MWRRVRLLEHETRYYILKGVVAKHVQTIATMKRPFARKRLLLLVFHGLIAVKSGIVCVCVRARSYSGMNIMVHN